MRNQKGITLVTLIITIIVLLILAIVSINLVINGGIIDKTKSAVDKYSSEEIAEQIKLAVLSAKLREEGTLNKITLQEELQRLNENITVEAVEDNFEIYFPNSVIYQINQEGDIIDCDNNTDIKYLYYMGKNDYIDLEIWVRQTNRIITFNENNITTYANINSYSWGSIRNTK